MNRILEPTTIEERKEEIAERELLNRQFLFTKDAENLYIKYGDKLIPLGGSVKQNTLQPGDNLEKGNEFHLDEIYITYSEGNISVKYKSPVLLKKCNLFIANPFTEEILINSPLQLTYTATDYEYAVNKERYEYTATVSHEFFKNYKTLSILVEVKGNTTSYLPKGNKEEISTWATFIYGCEVIRLKDNVDINTLTLSPDGDETYKWKGMYKLGELYDNNAIFILTKKSETIHDPDKGLIGGEILIKMVDENDQVQYAQYAVTCTSTGSWSLSGAGCTPSNVRMCLCKHKTTGEYYYGLRLPIGEYDDFGIVDTPDWKEEELSAYVGLWAGNDKDDLRFYSDYTPYKQLTKETHVRDYGFETGDNYSRDLWTIPITEVDDMLQLSKDHSHILDEDAKSDWRDWLANNYKLGITLDTKDTISDAWYIYQISQSVYLRKTGLESWRTNQAWATYTLYRGNVAYQLTDRGTDASIYNSDVSTYNHWYTLPMPSFFNLLGFRPQGQWAPYNNNNYLFGIRIYTKQSATRVTLVAILRNNSALTQVKVIGADDQDIEFNWDSSLVNLKSTVSYNYEEVYPSMNNYDTMDIFKFIDRDPLVQRKGLKIHAVDVKLLDENNNSVDFDFTRFDQSFVINNYNLVSNFTNNRKPIFSANDANSPILFYGNQEGVEEEDDSTSLLGIQKISYKYITAHHLEERKFIANLVLKKAEFWFNGWKHIPDKLTISGYTDADWSYTVLSDKSNDNDSYAETMYYATVAEYKDLTTGLPSKQDTGEDNAPYKVIITQEYLSMQDLLDIAEYVRHLERQVALDLSNCKVLDDAKNWTTSIFEGCVSLREIWIPQGVEEFGQGIFKWCTYLRKLDLTPSADTLHTIGGTSWEQNSGFLVSTRVTTLFIPGNVSLLRNYLTYSSNIKNLIMLHDHNIGFKEDQTNSTAIARKGTLSASEWAWVGQSGVGSLVYDLPEGFHIFFSKDFWENGKSLGNNYGQPNKNGTGWDWYPTMENYTRWNKRVIDSIVIFDAGWSQKEWQAFEDVYAWGEDLINEVRAKFGYDQAIDIRNATV